MGERTLPAPSHQQDRLNLSQFRARPRILLKARLGPLLTLVQGFEANQP